MERLDWRNPVSCLICYRRAQLYHKEYGHSDSKSGARTTKGVVRRLQEAGFTQVIAKPQAFGVVALK